MKTASTFSLILGLAAAAAVQLGCVSTPASQPNEDASVPQVEEVSETEPSQSAAPSLKSSQADSVQPLVTARAMDEPQEEIVEVGYKKGMHVQEFGMSLLDGTRVTSAKLVEEGKPIFVYFHATW